MTSSSKRCATVALLLVLVSANPANTMAAEKASSSGPPDVNFRALRLAIENLSQTYRTAYPNGQRYLARLAAFEKAWPQIAAGLKKNFDRLLLVRLGERSPRLGLTANWQGNGSLPRSGFDDEIAILSSLRPGGKLTTLYRPEGKRFVGDVDLHFDGRRMLFSSIGTHGRWQVFEINVDGTSLRQVTRGEETDVDNYDACYLSSGKIIYTSTAVVSGHHDVPRMGELLLFDAAKLVQMLRKGHHGVRLDAEAWDRIITWIDLHAPAHGTWHEIVREKLVARRRGQSLCRSRRLVVRPAEAQPLVVPPRLLALPTSLRRGVPCDLRECSVTLKQQPLEKTS